MLYIIITTIHHNQLNENHNDTLKQVKEEMINF